MLNESDVDLADPLLTEVAEIVTVCFPVWRLVISLVYGSMPKKMMYHKLYDCRGNNSQLEGASPSTEHRKLLKSAEFEHETVNCVEVWDELQLRD